MSDLEVRVVDTPGLPGWKFAYIINPPPNADTLIKKLAFCIEWRTGPTDVHLAEGGVLFCYNSSLATAGILTADLRKRTRDVQ